MSERRLNQLLERVAAERAVGGGRLFIPARVEAPAPPRRRRRWLPYFLTDAATLALAVLATVLGEHAIGADSGPLPWAIGFAALTLFLIASRGGYRFRLQTSALDDLGLVVAVPAIVCTLIIGLRLSFDPDAAATAAPEAIRLWVFSTIYLMGGRVAAALVRQRTAAGHLNTLIIGAGVVGNTLARRLKARPELGLRPVGFIDDDPLLDTRQEPHGVPVLGTSGALEALVQEHDVEYIIIAFSTAGHAETLDIVRRCRSLGVEVALVPRLYEEMSSKIDVEHLGGIAMLRVDRADPRGWQFECKYAIDRILGGFLLLLAAPLMAVIALAVRLSSPGPVVFSQRRVGLDGQEFDIYKFRTMRGGGDAALAEAEWIAKALGVDEHGVLEAAEDRRTRVGRFLRNTSLDELPQLWNVVRGNMSLIGPRPERPGCADMFGEHVYRYGDRHRVKSGVTGWAQVNGLRGDTSIADRIEWDNFYIENWSPWLDLKILLLTPAALIGHDHG